METALQTLESVLSTVFTTIDVEIIKTDDGTPIGVKILDPDKLTDTQITAAIAKFREVGGSMDVFTHFAIGDLMNTKKYGEVESAVVRLFGNEGYYQQARQDAFVARQWPVEKRVKLPHWYVYRELAKKGLSEDFKACRIKEAIAGKLSNESLRQQIKVHEQMQTAWEPRDEPLPQPTKKVKQSDGTEAEVLPAEIPIAAAIPSSSPSAINYSDDELHVESSAAPTYTATAFTKYEPDPDDYHLAISWKHFERAKEIADWFVDVKKEPFTPRSIVEMLIDRQYDLMHTRKKFSS